MFLKPRENHTLHKKQVTWSARRYTADKIFALDLYLEKDFCYFGCWKCVDLDMICKLDPDLDKFSSVCFSYVDIISFGRVKKSICYFCFSML